MDIDQVSSLLFGRYQALRLYAAIADLPKPHFTTGELAALTGLAPPVCSKELSRLVEIGVLRTVSRRGEYERIDVTAFWHAIAELGETWAEPNDTRPSSDWPQRGGAVSD